MSLPVPVVWSEDCLRHEPGGEVWLGVRDDGTELPARALVLREALAAAGAAVVPAVRMVTRSCARSTTADLVDHLAGVWQDWAAAGLPAEYGRDRVVPYVFPTAGMLAGLPERSPPAVHGRAGRFCYDTMTLVGPGSWAAIRGAADAALTAADLVGSGARLAYALCRPPGHHVTRRRLRRVLLPQQRRDRRAGAAGRRGTADRDPRHRCPPRQRHPDDLLRPGGRLVRLAARRSGRGVVPALRRLRGGTRPRRGRGRQPQPAAAPRNRGRGTGSPR